MKSSFVKVVVGCGGAVGTTCAVGLPLSSLGRPEDHATNQLVDQEGVGKGCLLTGSSALVATIKGQQVDFGKLGNRISAQLNKKNLCNDLMGKTNLQSILEDEPNYKWEIKSEDGVDCDSIQPCGYLELEKKGTKKLNRYKIRISKSSIKELQVIVVKDGNKGTPSYYEGYPNLKQVDKPGWQTVNGVEGEHFTSIKESKSIDGGSKITGASIKQNLKET